MNISLETLEAIARLTAAIKHDDPLRPLADAIVDKLIAE